MFDRHIAIKVKIPNNYREQLSGLEVLFGEYNAPYFPGPEFDYSSSALQSQSPSQPRPASGRRRDDSGDTIRANGVSAGFGIGPAAVGDRRRSTERKDRPKKLTQEARELWAGYRGIEEYAREVFPVEEEANGKTWMSDKAVST